MRISWFTEMTESVLIAVVFAVAGVSLVPAYRLVKRLIVRERYKRVASARPYRRTNGTLRYQMRKEEQLKPLEPPPGIPEDAAERFRKLSPLHQHQALEARRRLSEQSSA